MGRFNGLGIAVMSAALCLGCGPADSDLAPDASDPDASVPDAGAEPSTISVKGRVATYQGLGLDAYRVVLVDAAGPRPAVLTNADGTFRIPDVEVPYSISVVPLKDTQTAITFDGVTRADPTVVVHDSGLAPPCAKPATVVLQGTFAQPLPAGRTSKVYFVAEKLHPVSLDSNVTKPLNPGDTTYSLEVPLKQFRCPDALRGRLIFIETDPSGHPIRSASHAVTLDGTQNPVVQDVSPMPAAPVAISGRVDFQPTSSQAFVSLYFKVGNAYALYSAIEVRADSPEFTFSVPSEFEAFVTARIGTYFALAPAIPGTSVTLRLPEPTGHLSPSGPTDSATPTFMIRSDPEANLHVTLVKDGAANRWIGVSASRSIGLPALPPPAALERADSLDWRTFAFTAAPGVTVDALLDGRLIEGLHYLDWALAPEFVSAGAHRVGTTFQVP